MGKVISTLLFLPPREPTYLNSKKYFWLTTSTGSKIPAFFIRQNHARYTILYSHGNAEDLGMIYDYLIELSELLYINIMAYDYSGYGLGSMRKDNRKKKVVPSEKNCYADIEAALEHLIKVELISLSQIVLYGRSVGSGPSCYLAQKLNKEEKSVAGLILHSPFLSVCRVVLDMGFEMKYDVFPNISRIKDVGCPTFIMHGTMDEVVPFSHGKGLYDALPEDMKYPPFWAENMRHNNIEAKMTASFIRRLQKFFLHLQKIPNKHHEKGKDAYSTVYETLETYFGISLSSDSMPSVVSDSEDDAAEGKSVPFMRIYSKDMRSNSSMDMDDDISTKSSSTEKFKSAALFYRTISLVSRDEIECMMHQSGNDYGKLKKGAK